MITTWEMTNNAFSATQTLIAEYEKKSYAAVGRQDYTMAGEVEAVIRGMTQTLAIFEAAMKMVENEAIH